MLSSIKTIAKFTLGTTSAAAGYGDAFLDGIAHSIDTATQGGVVARVAARSAKDNFHAGKDVGAIHYATTADVVQDYAVEPLKDVAGAFTDLFTTDTTVVPPKSNGGLGGFGARP